MFCVSQLIFIREESSTQFWLLTCYLSFTEWYSHCARLFKIFALSHFIITMDFQVGNDFIQFLLVDIYRFKMKNDLSKVTWLANGRLGSQTHVCLLQSPWFYSTMFPFYFSTIGSNENWLDDFFLLFCRVQIAWIHLNFSGDAGIWHTPLCLLIGDRFLCIRKNFLKHIRDSADCSSSIQSIYMKA